jgi:hypothetical protein
MNILLSLRRPVYLPGKQLVQSSNPTNSFMFYYTKDLYRNLYNLFHMKPLIGSWDN